MKFWSKLDTLNTLTPSAANYRGLIDVQDLRSVRLVRAKRDNRTKRAFSTGLVQTYQTKRTQQRTKSNGQKYM